MSLHARSFPTKVISNKVDDGKYNTAGLDNYQADDANEHSFENYRAQRKFENQPGYIIGRLSREVALDLYSSTKSTVRSFLERCYKISASVVNAYTMTIANIPDYYGNFPLHRAIVNQDLKAVKQSVKKGALLNVCNLRWQSPLTLLIKELPETQSNFEILEFLLNVIIEKARETDQIVSEDNNLLELAVYQKKYGMAQIIKACIKQPVVIITILPNLNSEIYSHTRSLIYELGYIPLTITAANIPELLRSEYQEVFTNEMKTFLKKSKDDAVAKRLLRSQIPGITTIKDYVSNGFKIVDGIWFKAGEDIAKVLYDEWQLPLNLLIKELPETQTNLEILEFMLKVMFEKAPSLQQLIYEDNNLLELAVHQRKYGMAQVIKACLKRPVVIITTFPRLNGVMYNLTKSVIFDLGFVPVTITVANIPELSQYDYNNVFENEIKPFLKEEKDSYLAKGLMRSQIPALITIKDYVSKGFKIADAIWLAGGADIGKFLYDKQHQEIQVVLLNEYDDSRIDPRWRDFLEVAILDFQRNSDYLPLLGVCRGHQMINVFNGGTLGQKSEHWGHRMTIVKDSGLLGKGLPSNLDGNSFHYQAIETLGEGLSIVMVSAKSLYIKAIQSQREALPLMGTQYHPEYPLGKITDDHSANNHVLHRFKQVVEAASEKKCLNTANVETFSVTKKCKID